MIGMVCLAAAASAAPAQSFDELLTEYGLDAADPQVQAHVFPVNDRVTVLGIELCVECLYYDGDRLLIGWKTDNLEPEQPALVQYTNVRLGGISVEADADYPLSLWWPQAFGLFVTGDPINGLMNGFYSSNAREFLLEGTREAVLSFTVIRPSKPLAVVDAYILTPYENAGSEADRQAMLAALAACGVTVASSRELDVQAWLDKGYLAVNGAGEFLNGEGAAVEMPVFNGEGLTDIGIADITISFTADYDALAGQ